LVLIGLKTYTRATFSSFAPEKNGKMSETARLKSTVYVGGLDQAVTTQTLAEAFVPFGEVVDITLPKPDVPSSTDLHRGFGYVEFDLPQDATEAIDNMDGSELFGRTIKVAAAKPQKDSNEGLGSKNAIWEQVRYTQLRWYSNY
jgi:RNA recognition motif-containing protein